jgi:hypothetical protein
MAVVQVEEPAKTLATAPGHAKYRGACTTITIGDGTNVKSWHDRWIHSQSPMEMAPALYRLARRKNITVAKAMEHGNWMKGLQRISGTEETNQFVALWHRLQSIHLTDRDDEISWNFTSSGKYSSKSAYTIQLVGTFPDFE